MSDKELFLIITSNEKLLQANAVILLEGDGFERIKKACALVNNKWASFLVFSGAIENLPYGSYPYDKCLPLIEAEGIPKSKIIWEAQSLHTKQQADNVIAMCVEKKWDKIILVASHYHQYRAFLTFLKVLIDQDLHQKIKIYNHAATDMAWFTASEWGVRSNLLDNEFERIEVYKQKGDIAEYHDAVNYYKWRELQQ